MEAVKRSILLRRLVDRHECGTSVQMKLKHHRLIAGCSVSPEISVSNLQARVTLDGERAYPSNASAPSCMPGQRTWGGVSFPADGDARPRHLGRRNSILLIFIYKDFHVNTLLFIFSVLLPKVEELVEESRKLILWGGTWSSGGGGGHGPWGTPASSS